MQVNVCVQKLPFSRTLMFWRFFPFLSFLPKSLLKKDFPTDVRRLDTNEFILALSSEWACKPVCLYEHLFEKISLRQRLYFMPFWRLWLQHKISQTRYIRHSMVGRGSSMTTIFNLQQWWDILCSLSQSLSIELNATYGSLNLIQTCCQLLSQCVKQPLTVWAKLMVSWQQDKNTSLSTVVFFALQVVA